MKIDRTQKLLICHIVGLPLEQVFQLSYFTTTIKDNGNLIKEYEKVELARQRAHSGNYKG